MGLKEVVYIGPYHLPNCNLSASFQVDDHRQSPAYSRTDSPSFKIEVYLKKKFVNVVSDNHRDVVSVVGSLTWKKTVAGSVGREVRTNEIVGSIPINDSSKKVIGSTLKAVIDRVSGRDGGGEVDVVVEIEYEEVMTSHEVEGDVIDDVEEEEEEEKVVCAVCVEDLTVGRITLPVVLPCHHMFHRSCISRWLAISMTCPTCRSHVI